MPLTFADINRHVIDELQPETAKPAPSLILRLANQALDMLSEQARPVEKEWSSPQITVTAGQREVSLPEDLIEIVSVKYNGILLDPITRQSADTGDRYWESLATDAVPGTPFRYFHHGSTIELDPPPDNPSLLVIRASVYIGQFTADGSGPNPLAGLPRGAQLAPAYYVLAMIPADPDDKRAGSRVNRNLALWSTAVGRAKALVRDRFAQDFTYE